MQKAQRDHAINRIDEVVQKHEQHICGCQGSRFYRNDGYHNADPSHELNKLFPFKTKPYASKSHILKAIENKTFAFIDTNTTDIFKTIVPTSYAKAWFKVMAARNQELKERKIRLKALYRSREKTIDQIMLGDEQNALDAIASFRNGVF